MKKAIALLLVCLMLCTVVFAGCGSNDSKSNGNDTGKTDASNSASDAGGETSESEGLKKNADGLVEIYTAEDLVAYREFANNEMNEAHKKDITETSCKTGFILMADIDMSSVSDWEPIGRDAVVSGDSRSVGLMEETVIDGNNHTISNFNISGNYCSLFYWMGSMEVKNLTFKNCTLTASDRGAMIASSVGDCKFTNITLEDSVKIINTKKYYAGGLVIEAEDTVFENCNSAATIEGNNKHFLVANYDKYDKSVVFNNCNNTGGISD